MKLLIHFIIFIIIIFIPQTIFAQSFSLTIDPQFNEVISKRNKIITFPYNLTNLGDPQVIRLTVYKLQVKDASGSFDLLPYENTEEMISFEIPESAVQLNTPFLIKAKNTLSFDLVMTIPETVAETDYYFALVAESDSQKVFGNTSSIAIQGGVGSHILLTVTDSGELQQEGKIIQFDILSSKTIHFGDQKIAFFDSNEIIPVLLTAANTGKNVTRTSGSITLLPSLGKPTPQSENATEDKGLSKSISYTIIPKYLLSGSQGVLKTTNNPACENNNIEICKQSHSIAIYAPLIGMYRVSSLVSFGENAQIAYGNVTFISFPFRIVSLFVISFLVIYVLSRLVQKRFKTRLKENS